MMHGKLKKRERNKGYYTEILLKSKVCWNNSKSKKNLEEGKENIFLQIAPLLSILHFYNKKEIKTIYLNIYKSHMKAIKITNVIY